MQRLTKSSSDPFSPESAVRGFHAEIIAVASQKLGRTLTDQELRFVTSRGGFIALEMILDTVRSVPSSDLERYLNSEGKIFGGIE
jgi:microsomal dipeptidase-like Zn-dependent dipeptidase